jgi:hypothetical protein
LFSKSPGSLNPVAYVTKNRIMHGDLELQRNDECMWNAGRKPKYGVTDHTACWNPVR